MNTESMELLKEVINNSDVPVLIEDYNLVHIKNYVEVDALAGLDNFIENSKNEAPAWYYKLDDNNRILVIRNIDSLRLDEQSKIGEILKYRKVGSHKLKDNVKILVTCGTMNYNNISKNIISLTSQIR